MTREQLVAALRTRIRQAVDADDSGVLDAAAMTDAEALRGTGPDLESLHVLGLFHLARYCAQPLGYRDFRLAFQFFFPVYQHDPGVIPEPVRQILAGDASATGLYFDPELSEPFRQIDALLAASEETGEPDAGFAAAGLLCAHLTSTPPAPAVVHEELASCLYRLSTRLSQPALLLFDQGRQAEGVAVASEAVALFRQAAEAEPGVGREVLAVSLSNLGGFLCRLGRQREGLPLIEEAVTLHRTLAGGSQPDLAMALNNLANCLSDLGQRPEGLAAAEEAVTLCRPLAVADPVYLPRLAMALRGLSVRLALMGHAPRALAVAQESVQVYRELAALRPEVYQAHLAATLHALCLRFAGMGRGAEALTAIEESVALYRAADPAGHRAGLARSLDALGTRLNAAGKDQGSMDAGNEAVALYRVLADADPVVHQRDLATSLNNLGLLLFTAGRREEARTASEEAVTLLRALAERDADAHRAMLGSLLSTLSLRLMDTGRHEAAVAASAEAVTIFRPLAAANPAAHQHDLAGALTSAGLSFSELGRHDEAVLACTEAAGLFRTLAQENPAAYRRDLAVTVANLVPIFMAAGRLAEALAPAEEAAGLYRALAQTDPAAYRYQLAIAVVNLSKALANAGRWSAAVPGLTEVATDPAVSPQLRLDAFSSWALLRERSGNAQEALTVYEQGLGLLPLVAPRTARRRDRELGLTDVAGIGPQAAGAAIAAGQLQRAVEILEQARGVLMTDAIDARGDLARLRAIDAVSADRLGQLRSELSAAEPDFAGGQLTRDEQAHRAAQRRTRADTELRDLIEKIRRHPGLHDFLRPLVYADLAEQARAGPVIVVNVSPVRCDALILTEDQPRHVRLDLTHQQVEDNARAFLATADACAAGSLTSDEGGTRMLSILAWLWDHVTGPVLGDLNPRPGARVWWCPTGPLSLLPLHAAGHHQAADGRTVLDRVTSSYTPTLTALAHARAADSAATGHPLLISMPHTPDEADLPGVVTEVAALATLMPEALRLTGPEATSDRVLRELPHRSVVHFACHGTSDLTEPSGSHLLLHDHRTQPLTVSVLARMRLPAARLAYLSACSTSMTSHRLPDEAIHITSALQLAGYPQVIGTLWPINDQIAASIARGFYASLTANGSTPPQHRRAPYALHEAVRQIRDQHLSRPILWAAHVHIGA